VCVAAISRATASPAATVASLQYLNSVVLAIKT